MADKAQITEALKKLDAGNDEHWTQGKEPTVAAVSELVGEAVTRDDINAAAEGFNRDTAPGFFMAVKPWEAGQSDTKADDAGDGAQVDPEQGAIKDPDINPGQDAEGNITGIVHDEREVTSGEDGDNIDADGDASGVPSGTGIRETDDSPGPPFNPADVSPAPSSGDTSGPAGIGDATESPRADGAAADDAASASGGPVDSDSEAELETLEEPSDSADEIASLEKELASRKKNIDGLRVALDDAQKAYNKAQGEADAIAERIEQLRPRNSNQGVINAYLESQKKRGQERGENRQALKDAGVDLKKLQKAVGRAPIDESMARRNSRGTSRPSHPRG